MNPVHLSVYIWMYLNDLIREEYVHFPEIFLNFSDITDNGIVLGTARFINLSVTGFETLVSEINNIEATEDENGNNNVCVYTPMDYLQLTTDYDADIGIADEIPIYGEGKFQITASNIDLKICTFVSFDDGYADNVHTTFLYRHNPIKFTGFWKNRRATDIILRFLNVFNSIFAMWNAYQPESASCILSPFIEYVFNKNMENENYTPKFNTTCLQGIFVDLGLIDNERIEEYISTAVENYRGDQILESFLEENKSFLLDWINPVVTIIERTISEYVVNKPYYLH